MQCKCLLSIIIPIYNVEKYLHQCINSVLQQEFNDFELILVDDGSTDNCPHICDEYLSKDERLKVIHKNNGGLSDARNAGMEISKGAYILFLDSDDFLTDDCLKKAADVLISKNYPDILLSTFNSLFTDNDKELNNFHLTNQYSEVDNQIKFLTTLLKESNEIQWSACRNIYKTNLINTNIIKFEKGLVGAEDCAFFMEYTKYLKNYAVMEYPLFNYRISREGSITTNIKYSAIIGQLKVFIKYFHEYNQIKSCANYKLSLNNYFAEKFANTISTFYFLKNNDEIILVETMAEENKEILKYTCGIKYTIAKTLWNIFGYYKGSQIMNRVRRT
ncbi:Undecaprenyl-phosphate 4-deoxy-4-formamido-L-arabinose transferase [bioreactor metagenome]|uniref:Undecaprenyl-phosphate 4-deoxy-4-formamido-L-arabinose transferase n=1 Tax=bioreactor metagenome TaxID=1076179 RepID=A0A644TJI8_9ZZZZ|nr:glycosyltransferase family 2 protein [Acidaminococcaceae bacterium]